MMKTTTPVSPEAFVRAWQEEQSLQALAARVRSTEQAAIQRAFRYRRRGIQLKYFKLGPRLDTKALKKLAVEIAP